MKLRILSYNIHKCIGGIDRKYRPERIAEVIAHYDPDLVLLQEVDAGVKRSQNHEQVNLLGDLMGYRHRTFFPNVRIRSGGHYGNAILSKFPLTDTENVDLTIPPKKKRSVLHARYRVRLHAARSQSKKTRTLHVFNMHLGLSGFERQVQLKKFLECEPFKNLDRRTPILVGGDFNDVWGGLGKLLEPEGFRRFGKGLRTFPAYAPMRALDSMYIRGRVRALKMQRAQVQVAKQASDHLPLIGDFVIY